MFEHFTVSADEPPFLLSNKLQNGGLGPPGASPEGARKLPGTSSGRPGTYPRPLQSTTSAYLKRSTCPKELPGGPKVVLGAQKTPFASSRALKVRASQLSTFVACPSKKKPLRLRCGLCVPPRLRSPIGLGGGREAQTIKAS